jgi:hypothetical protein
MPQEFAVDAGFESIRIFGGFSAYIADANPNSTCKGSFGIVNREPNPVRVVSVVVYIRTAATMSSYSPEKVTTSGLDVLHVLPLCFGHEFDV